MRRHGPPGALGAGAGLRRVGIFLAQRRVGDVARVPAGRAQAVVLDDPVAVQEARGELQRRGLGQLLVDLHLVLGGDDLVVGLERQAVRPGVEGLGRQRLVGRALEDHADVVGAARGP